MNHWQNFYHDATAEMLDEVARLIALSKRPTLKVYMPVEDASISLRRQPS